MYCKGFLLRLAALAKGSEVVLKMRRRKFHLIVKESDSTEEGTAVLQIQRAHAQNPGPRKWKYFKCPYFRGC